MSSTDPQPGPDSQPSTETDVYDDVPRDPLYVGRHRADFTPPASGYRRIVAAGLAALVVGLICAIILPLAGVTPKASTRASTPTQKAATAQMPSAAPSISADPALKKRTVNIYNVSGATDREKEMAQDLAAKGWIVGAFGEGYDEDPGRTTVYYSGAAAKRSAELLSQELGGTQVAEDASVGSSLKVVISAGYKAG